MRETNTISHEDQGVSCTTQFNKALKRASVLCIPQTSHPVLDGTGFKAVTHTHTRIGPCHHRQGSFCPPCPLRAKQTYQCPASGSRGKFRTDLNVEPCELLSFSF